MFDIVDLLAPWFAPISEKELENRCEKCNNKIADFTKSLSAKKDNIFTIPVPYSYKVEKNFVHLEVIVTGHNPNNVKVKWNENEHILKVVDETNVPEENRPWYYENLDLKFHLPETTVKESFVKKIENGVLTVSVKYEPDDDTKAMPATEIEIR